MTTLPQAADISLWLPSFWAAIPLPASLLFGIANAVEIRLQALGVHLPSQALAMLPYIITLCALLLTSGRNRQPEALGTPYIRGGR